MKLNLTPLVPAVAVFNMFSNALMLTGPLFLLQVYERVLASRPEETLVDLFALMVGLFALLLCLSIPEDASWRMLAQKFSRN